MPLTKEAFRTPAPDSASLSEVNATLAYLPAWIEAFDRRMIARDSQWLSLGEALPEICNEMATVAARSICAQPAIVWG